MSETGAITNGNGVKSGLPLSAAVLFPGRATITVQEMAGALRITATHVKDLLEEGKILGVNATGNGGIGAPGRKRWRIPVDSFDQFVKANLS
jgi:hypothetical protein